MPKLPRFAWRLRSPNPTRTAITKAKTNAAMAAQKAMVPITEKA